MTAPRELAELKAAKWADLTEPTPEVLLTPVETAPRDYLSPMQQHWVDHGFVVLERALPDELIDRYCAVRGRLANVLDSEFAAARAKRERADFHGGYAYPTPFMVVPELRDLALYPPVMRAMFDLTAFPMALNLSLTGWVSTERNWHQDNYLNPGHLGHYYVAAWMSLDDISADAGPFQFVPGSHKWEALSQEKLFKMIPRDWPTSPHWPTWTQDEVARVCAEEIEKRGAKVQEFIPKRGDVLLWHSDLVHRGSPPRDRGILRKALIGHYSSVAHRLDMGKILRHDNGQLFFDLPCEGAVKP